MFYNTLIIKTLILPIFIIFCEVNIDMSPPPVAPPSFYSSSEGTKRLNHFLNVALSQQT